MPMRMIHRRRTTVAFLAGLLFWSASLVHGTREALAAPSVVPVSPAECVSRPDDVLIRLEQKQKRLEAARLARVAAAQRQEREAEEQYQRLVRQDVARREAAARRIADLVPDEFIDVVLDTAQRYEMDPRFLAAVGTVESQWYARALGTNGDSGLMQILPSTAEWIASQMGLDSYDLYDPVTNLNMGAWYLHALYHDYGSWDSALAAYNGGPRGAPKGAAHPYTQRVMRVYSAGIAA
ncbi:MAG TPA: lytic transglycosylase domain-containing protein [Symbiobacteriaceae bacterium]|nr:lytic transglycosylase domain-containing protein [Symbiobacteriaceae bacterium]